MLRLNSNKNEKKLDEDNEDDESKSVESESNESDLDENEKNLEALVFGSKATILEGIEKHTKHHKRSKKQKNEIASVFEKRKAVWKDEDDEQQVDLSKFEKLADKINVKKAKLVTNNEIEETLKAK